MTMRNRLARAPRLLRGVLSVAALVLAVVGLAAQEPAPSGPAPATPSVVVLSATGVVTPAMSDYLRRGLDAAAERRAPLVILRMDTPGGLDSSMREIVSAILASPVPVATWVAPSGARAASAGTYILYASHIAAMAPATHLGAATPVALGGGGGSPDGGDGADAPPRPTTAGERKAVNDAVAYIRGLADLRDRNADWAEAAVREAATLSAGAAAEAGVIDFVAPDIAALLAGADGRSVAVGPGTVTLATAGLTVEEITPDWRTELLSILTNPNVALILMLVGVYGLILEFLNPGVLVAGTLGGISLILGLYALALLPLNYAGALLILLGLALIVAEAFAPSFGVLGIGGTAALVLGAIILVDIDDVPGLTISAPLVAGIAVSGAIATLIVAWLARRSFRARVVSGREHMIGARARVTDWEGARGHVWVEGERWTAAGAHDLAPGDEVRVTALDGLVVTVERGG